jgi:glycosyltransferase involved in cell wall biosynthesis
MQKEQSQSTVVAMIGQKGIPASWGGVEQHVHHLSLELAARNTTVVVYSREYYASRDAAQELQEQHPNIRIQFMPTIATKYMDTIVSTLLATFHALFVVRPDIYHYHSVGPSLLSFIPRLFAPRSKVIVTFHSADREHAKWGRFARFVLTCAEWTALVFPHETITVSKKLQNYSQGRYDRQAHYIPNGVRIVPPEKNLEVMEQFGLQPNGYYLIVTRFVPHKGVHYAIEAWKGIQTVKKLVIVGDATFGTERYAEQLKEMAKEDPRIIFTGTLSGEPLKALYSSAYATIHPSVAEGLSIVLLESASYGKGIIASDIPENREVLEYGGFPFAPQNISALREMITYTLQYPEAVMVAGRSLREHVALHYNWSRIAQNTIAVYDQPGKMLIAKTNETVTVPTR